MTAMEALTERGFQVVGVEEQMTPDGQFPNVTRTPNPEVPESMDRAAALADRRHADLVLATDPDADRVGAMIPPAVVSCQLSVVSEKQAGSSSSLTTDNRQLTTAGWRYVTGNQIAALLTHFKLSKLAQQNRLPPSPIVVTTAVTTRQVTRIARRFNAQVIDNLLVGFKYVADVLRHLEQHGRYEDVEGSPADFVIATEESHGILLTPQIRDKDAGSAALLLAELALDQKRRGQTVLDYLDRLAREFGYFRNEGVPVFLRGLEGNRLMRCMLDRLREAPPREIAGLAVTSWEDLRDENGRLGPLKGATDAAARNVLVFHLGEQARVVLRPSGTEPKAKIYVEVCSSPSGPGMGEDVWRTICRDVDGLVRNVSEAFVRHALSTIGLSPSAAG